MADILKSTARFVGVPREKRAFVVLSFPMSTEVPGHTAGSDLWVLKLI
jgi:hypothetical protein